MAGEEIFSTVFSGWGGSGFWFVNSILAVLITAIIMGTLYVIAIAFDFGGLKRYSVSEFMQLAATAIMIIFLVSMIEGGQQLFIHTFGSGMITCGERQVSDPLDAAMCRTEERLDHFNNMFFNIKDSSELGNTEFFYYFSITILGMPIVQGHWFSDVHKYVETAHAIEYKIVSLLISLNSQMFVLKYIQKNMLAFFLPLGIVLRTLHFTRGIGGFFIALAISLYFIYPGMLFLLDQSYVTAPPPSTPPSTMNREDLCSIPVFTGFSLGSVGMSGVGGTRAAAALSISSEDLASFISQTFVKLFYDNMVAFAIAMTCMRYGTMLLGGESGVFLQMMARWI